MERTYYIVRNVETGSCIRGYGSGQKSAPMLYLNYGTASHIAHQYNREGVRFQVVQVKLEEIA